ncbi:HNH endonuclease signature motif containing protein, partial [Serratia marcescens]|uniref:HNH endonuclease signature motif containing protein n=1 Tax=Serratia marcescens TaxID=615 RepID=UPI000A7FB81D
FIGGGRPFELSYQELTEALNYRFNCSHTKLSVRNKIVSMRLGKTIRLERQYTEAQLSFLYTNRELPYVELTQSFNRMFGENKTEGAIRVTMRTNGWGRHCNRSIRQDRKIEIKGRRLPLDNYVWECINGPIPLGYTVVHLDDDVENNDIDNLRLAPSFTRSAFLRAGGGTAPKALAPALYAKTMLQNVIRKIERTGAVKPAVRERG